MSELKEIDRFVLNLTAEVKDLRTRLASAEEERDEARQVLGASQRALVAQGQLLASAEAVVEAARRVENEWTVRGDGGCSLVDSDNLRAALSTYDKAPG